MVAGMVASDTTATHLSFRTRAAGEESPARRRHKRQKQIPHLWFGMTNMVAGMVTSDTTATHLSFRTRAAGEDSPARGGTDARSRSLTYGSG